MPRAALLLPLLLAACTTPSPPPAGTADWRDEVIYHVLVRSFHDADGDRHGDLRGLTDRLPYLEELGVTTLLLLPVFESDFYHNYFPTDFRRIDAEYGTLDDWTAFVRAAHARGMRVLMDMETQYVPSGHPWLEAALADPSDPRAAYVGWTDSTRSTPLGVFGLDGILLPLWPDLERQIAMLDLSNPEVRAWTQDLFAWWADPDGDGTLDDGVDGFRIDHIMDDLDYRSRFTDLYRALWAPVFARARAVNPDLFVIGEQADWNTFGDDMVRRSGADAAFGFPLRFAVAGTHPKAFGDRPDLSTFDPLDPVRIDAIVHETLARFPDGAGWVTFLENHDTERWASAVAGHPGRIRAGAVLNVLLPGIPAVYYGQELGLPGVQGDWGFDANDIPIREAFPWSADPDGPGVATWYRGDAPWWDGSIFVTGAADRLALPVQRADPSSVWHLYRELIALRRDRPELRRGAYETVAARPDGLYAFARTLGDRRTVVVLNLSETPRNVSPDSLGAGGAASLLGAPAGDPVALPPYGFAVLGR